MALFSKPASLSLLSRHLLKSFVCSVRVGGLRGWGPVEQRQVGEAWAWEDLLEEVTTT